MSDGIWFQDMSSTYPFVPKDKKERLDTIADATVILEGIHKMLVEKNTAYGDSALNPLRLFSRADAVESLCVRIDDKINRIKNRGITPDTEDSVADLIGYLVLLQVARKRKGA